MQLIFDIEQKAIDAQKQIWINYVKERHVLNSELVGTGEIEYETLGGLSDDEISALKIYSLKSGEIIKNQDLSVAYADVDKINGIDKWYFEKPDLDLMADVVDFTEEEFDPNWAEDTE